MDLQISTGRGVNTNGDSVILRLTIGLVRLYYSAESLVNPRTFSLFHNCVTPIQELHFNDLDAKENHLCQFTIREIHVKYRLTRYFFP